MLVPPGGPPPVVLTPVPEAGAQPPTPGGPTAADPAVAPAATESADPPVVTAGATTPAPQTQAAVDPWAELGKNEAVKYHLGELKTQAAAGKPVAITAEQLASLPTEAQPIIAALLYQQELQQQGLRQLEQQLTQKYTDAAKLRQEAAEERLGALDWTESDVTKQFFAQFRQKPGEVLDPYANPERAMEAKAASMLEQLVEKLSGDKTARQQQAETARQEADAATRRAQAIEWAKQHAADLDDPQIHAGMRELMKVKGPDGVERPTGISLQRAHELVMYERRGKELQLMKSRDLELAQERLERSRSQQPAIPETPAEYFKTGNTDKLLDFYARFPGAAARDAQRLAAQSRW
jgi:hypothetical protein